MLSVRLLSSPSEVLTARNQLSQDILGRVNTEKGINVTTAAGAHMRGRSVLLERQSAGSVRRRDILQPSVDPRHC